MRLLIHRDCEDLAMKKKCALFLKGKHLRQNSHLNKWIFKGGRNWLLLRKCIFFFSCRSKSQTVPFLGSASCKMKPLHTQTISLFDEALIVMKNSTLYSCTRSFLVSWMLSWLVPGSCPDRWSQFAKIQMTSLSLGLYSIYNHLHMANGFNNHPALFMGIM